MGKNEKPQEEEQRTNLTSRKERQEIDIECTEQSNVLRMCVYQELAVLEQLLPMR